MSDDNFTRRIECKHCGNEAPMRILYQLNRIEQDSDQEETIFWEAGYLFQFVICPACDSPALRKCYFHSGYMEGVGEAEWSTLYPQEHKSPHGLPHKIEKAYEAARKTRSIDANAYAVLVGRVLEMVCKDRGAKGKYLHNKIEDLSNKGDIPKNLAGVAFGLKNLRNVGAHSDLGELTEDEIPILDSLVIAILEYVYSAPHLAKQAEVKMSMLKMEN